MALSNSAVVLGVWIVAAIFAVTVISYAARRGWRDGPERAVAWREAKVLGAALGIFGLVAAMVVFEKTIRELNQDSEKYLMERFLDLKFNTTLAAAIACSGDQSTQDARNQCFDFTNIDGQVSFAALEAARDAGKHFVSPTNWQHNERLDPIIERASRTFDQLNLAVDSAYEKPILSQHSRIFLGFFALLLITVAVACSIGEAVFQLRQELARRSSSVKTT
jgi:hypothetical protein